MKKRIFSILLALVMLVGMLPVQAFAAATEVSVTGNVIDITDTTVYKVSSKRQVKATDITVSGATVLMATEDGTTVNAILSKATNPSATVAVAFGTTTVSGYTTEGTEASTTLADGSGTISAAINVKRGTRVYGTATYTINFTIATDDICEVTLPAGAGYTVTGAKVATANSPYSFQVAVDEAYNGTNMVVKANGETLTETDGTYTVESVTGDLIITVEGVVKKEVCAVTLTSGDGYTLSGADFAYKGDSYSFTVKADSAAYWTENMQVWTNGTTELTGEDGTYTIANVDSDQVITVTGLVAKKVYTVTKPDAAGVTFNGGDSVYEKDSYSFTLTVDHAYNSSAMVVTVNGEPITATDGTYTVEDVNEDLTIAVTGVVAKTVYTVTLPTVAGMSITGETEVLAGDDYTFTITVDSGYAAQNMVVTVNGTELTGTGSYTVSSVAQDLTVEVSASVERLPDSVDINKTCSNGSLNFAAFTDTEDQEIPGLEASIEGTAITVVLPQSFDPSGTVKATFNLTQNANKEPFISTKTAASGTSSGRAVNNKFTEKNIALSSGSATFTFYYFNAAPSVTNNQGQTTYTITIKVKNEAPAFAEGVTTPVDAKITAGESYELDLAPLFTDPEGQTLTYQVSINDADYVACDANYAYTTTVAGDYVLKFRATDGQDVSEDIYTVNLTVQNSSASYEVPVTVSDTVEGLTFYADTLEGDVLAYENGSVQIPQNVTTLWWKTGSGMTSSVAVSEATSLKLQLTTFDVKTAGGEVDPATKVVVTNPNGETSAANGFTYLLASGSGYTYAITAGSSWNAVTLTEQTVTEDIVKTIEVTLTLKNAKTVTVPSGATVYVYAQNGYSDGGGNDTEIAAAYSVTNPDDTVTYYYSIGGAGYGSGYSYVAFYEDRISYAGYFNDVTDVVLSWENETRKTGYRGAYDLSTTYGARGEDSVVTNVNSNGHLVLNTGAEFMLKAYRAWQIINSDTTNIIIEPEFNYETSNSNITVTPYIDRNSGVSGTSSNNWVYLTANASGTTYLEIGYDAVHIVDGYGSNNTGGNAGQPSNFTWNASDPNRTALIVVQTDGNAASGVKFGIQSPSGAWDYEYDTVYFTEEQGSLTMIPTATGGIGSVAVSHDKGSSYTTLTGTDGTYTVPITAGNNIIRITDGNGKTAYQVVRGAKVSYTVTNVTDGKAADDPIVPGDTVLVAFSTMHTVCPKISGIHNPGYGNVNKLNYKQNGIAVAQSPGYQYNFHNNVQIKVTAGNEHIALTGGYMDTPAGFGSAIGALYDAAAVNSSGSGTISRNILPDITIPVTGIATNPATAVTISNENVALGIGDTTVLTASVTPEDSTDKVTWSSSNTDVATVDENGMVTAVSAGSADITAAAGSVSAVCKVTVTQKQVSAIEIETDLADPTEIFSTTLGLSNIKISGVTPAGDVSGQDPDWTVNVTADSGDSVTITMQAALGSMMEGNLANWYFWVNGVLSEKAMGSYDGYTYSTTITPQWNDGTTVLTLCVGTATKIRSQYTVTLKKTSEVVVSAITLDKTSADLKIGDSLALQAAVTPDNATDKTVTWKSSDETVAAVDQNGVVSAIKTGTATITASAGDCRAECTVNVTEIAVSGITLDQPSAALKKGRTLTLTATVTPDNATNKTVIWESSNENVATVKDGVVTAVAEGTATVTAKAGDFSAACEVTVVKDDDGKATVYFSVSNDAAFVETEKGIVAALQKVDVPYFDLALYGLDDYKVAQTDPAYGEPTMLHLYIYATEILQCGVKAEDAGKGYLKDQGLLGTTLLKVSGAPGSMLTENFWGMDMNMNYYHNYVFPADSTGYGITAERVVVSDGDIVTIGHFTSWDYYADPTSIFNYLVADGKTVITSAVQDETLTMNVYRAGVDLGNGGGNTPVEAQRDIYYVQADAVSSGDVTSWTKLGTTDDKGQLKADISKLSPGQYILALAGQCGTVYTKEIVSTPGGIILNVLESEASKQVRAVIDLIDAIGEVTLDSEAAIKAARDAYDALSEELKAAVTNYSKLTDAEAKLTQLQQAKADQDAADAVTEKINAIGTVTLDSKNAIDEARRAYDALTEAQKVLVSEDMRKKLTDAEAAFAQLIADEADKAAAQVVADKIAAIGTVTLDSEQKITAARKAYDALTDTQKHLVENYDVLTEAEKKLNALKDETAADAVEEKIAAIGTVTLDSEQKIAEARAAYDALTDPQKALVENLAVLEAAEETLALLKLAGTDITNIYKTTGDYLAGLAAPTVGTTNGEWRVIGLSRAGRETPDSYYKAVTEYVKNNIDENGRLHVSKSTDNSRLIVALTAIGKDVTDVGGCDLLSGLNEMTYIGNQGINGTIWALIAFDSHDYEIPAGDVTREKLVQAIVDAQLAGGGWALGGIVGDPDMTGMALQALAPYYGKNTAATAAVDKALTWLSGIQNKDGTFTSSEGTTSESLSQVITGLTALGINPETDSRFVKNGVSAVDALSQFYVEGGGFKHGLTGDRNMMATEQGYYALVSYYRLLQNKTSLYDMSDVTIEPGVSDQVAADAVEVLIDAIGTVTKDSGETIEAARKAYDALTDAQKELVENYKTLTDAETAYTEQFKAAVDEAAANQVEALIDAIGTVTLSSEDKIQAARVAYDALTDDQKKLVENYKTLTDAESKLSELKSTVSVTFTLLGCSKHGTDTVHTLSGGNLSTWISKKTYMVAPGATVKDVLDKALSNAGMNCSNPTGNYVESINGIGEFTNGSNSGWMYTLNGTHPNLGIAEQTVKEGDVIIFHYTDDYTKEEGSQGYGDRDETAAEKVEKLIDAIGTVTLNSKSKIDAARTAYDDLTYTQKQLVENFTKLTAAESKYAELKAADDEKKAKAVEDLIDQISSSSSAFEEDVKAAQKAYNNLTADQKKLVDNYSKLVNALKELADEEDKEAAEAVEKLIDAIGTVTKDSEDDIKTARDAYNKLNDEQKALVGNLAVLEAAEEKLAALKALIGIEDIYKATGDYLEKLGTPVPGSVGGEWMVIGLARSGREIKDVDAYYEAAVQYVQENIDDSERLHSAKSTENSRMILALTAIGKDVTNVGGYNLLNGLNNMAYIQKQGINGPIWALLAFDSGNYPAAEGDVSREALIQVILDAQLPDGGWALSGSTSDADITGMALQALAPYYKTDANVTAAVEAAIETLSMMQAADGSFGSIDGVSSESVAQVIAALSALGIDAHTDVRFVKNGVSAIDALCTFYVEGGGFKHIPSGKLDGMATEQSYYALTAYFRMLDKETALYDMRDVIDMGGDMEVNEPVETLPAETEPAPTEPVEPYDEGGRSFPWWLVIVIVVLAGAIVVLVLVSKPKKRNKVR